MHNANIAPRGKGRGKMPQFDKLLHKCPESFDQGCSLGIGKPDRITGLQLLLLYNREILDTLRYTISVYRYC